VQGVTDAFSHDEQRTPSEFCRSQRQRLQLMHRSLLRRASSATARQERLMMHWVRRIYLALKLARCPHSLAASLAVLPSMSLIPSSSIVLIRGNHEPFNRLALNESIHNLRDVGDRDPPVKKVIGFD
jgi:hypothetical protein